MFTFQYEISENDYYEFNRFQLWNTPENKKQILLYRFMYPLRFMILATILSFALKRYNLIFYTYFGLCSIFWVVSYRKLLEYAIRRNIARIKKIGRLPYSASGTLSFFENELTDFSPISQMKIPYSSITKIAQTNTAFYLFFGALQAVIVPFPVFQDEQEMISFIEYIKQKTNFQ